MRALTAIFLDSLYETLDKKSLYVIAGLSLIFVVLAASVSFQPTPFGEVVKSTLPAFRTSGGPMGGSVWTNLITVGAVREKSGGTFEVEVSLASGDEARSMISRLERNKRMLAGEKVDTPRIETHPVETPDEGEDGGEPVQIEPPTPAEARELLRLVCEGLNYGFESVEPKSDLEAERAWFILTVKPPFEKETAGGGKISILFGAWSFKMPSMTGAISYAEFLMSTEETIASKFGGFFGVIIALIFTAGFFPTMLQAGSLDLLISKPVHRAVLFWGKYVGGLLYVFLSASVLIGGVWLAISIRSNFWNFGFLLTILNLTLLFGVLYSISVFWAVVSRSTVTAILMSILAWFLFSMITSAKTMVLMFSQMGEDIPDWVVTMTKAIYWIFPSTSDFDLLNKWSVAQAPISPELQHKFLEASGYFMVTKETPLGASIASSAAFAFVVLCVSCWIFCRKEY